MIDPELKKQLEVINNSVIMLGSRWKALINGFLAGLGYVLGALAAIIIIGYLLNVIGVIPALNKEVDQWKQILQQAPARILPSR